MKARSFKALFVRQKFMVLLAALLLVTTIMTACGDSTATTAPATTVAATTAAAAKTTAAVATTVAVPSAPPQAATTVAGTTAAATAATGKKGGVVKVALSQEPDTLNALFSSQTVSSVIYGLVTEPLIDISPDGQYIPKLAEVVPTATNGGVSADGLTLTYKLKKGVKWSDGKPFSSKDVAYTFKVIMDKDNGIPNSGYDLISKLDTPDDTTVVATFKELYAPYLTLFSSILPEHPFNGQTAIEKNDFSRKPLGTGPFVVKNWTSQENITMERNPNYRDAGKPYLDGIIFRIIKSRESAIQSFIANEVDVIWDLTEEQIPQFDKMNDAVLDIAQSVSTERLVLNMSNPKGDKPGDPTTQHPVLGDLKVRQAIQLGINKKLLTDSLLYGKTTVATAVIPQGWAKSKADPSEFNPEKAKAMLEEAGWKVGSDGVREKGGVKMKLEFGTTSGNKLREKTQQLIQEQLKAIGIQLEIKNVPSDQLFASWDKNGARKRGTFDILMWTTEPGIDPDDHIYRYFHSKNIPTAANKGGGANYSRWNNPDVDKAIIDAERTLDPAKRQAAYQIVNDKLTAELPQILLYNRLNIDAFKKTVKGHSSNIWATAWLAWNAEEWTLEK